MLRHGTWLHVSDIKLTLRTFRLNELISFIHLASLVCSLLLMLLFAISNTGDLLDAITGTDGYRLVLYANGAVTVATFALQGMPLGRSVARTLFDDASFHAPATGIWLGCVLAIATFMVGLTPMVARQLGKAFWYRLQVFESRRDHARRQRLEAATYL